VIPALNEEESIGSTVQRCLDARRQIQAAGGVDRIEVIVVSDGSTDRTREIAQEIADREEDVHLIVFEKNRGYGAAIKEGFRQGSGELVAFLDADGTCDPRYFGPMCRAVAHEQAAVVLGCRMGKESKMPGIRRLGNRMYALLLGMLSGKAVEDTASGMRVIRRDALTTLYPLPDGLHFTPAMSARALLTDLKVVEVPMDYAERQGRSKLSVLKDGVRFLVSIVEALLLFRPGRVFSAAATVCFLAALVWGLYPTEFYLRNQRLEEWMIYRVLFCAFAITCGCNLAAAGVLCDRILEVVFPASRQMRTFAGQFIGWCLAPGRLLLVGGLLAAGALWLVGGGLWEYANTGHVTIHWSRVVVASMLLQLSLLSVIGVIQHKVLALWLKELSQSVRPHR
jgi:glycosyltransferase involved in cell wall biosynthesis